MFDDNEAFQNAIALNPTDPLPMLVYADWLQEQDSTGLMRVYRLAATLLNSGDVVAFFREHLGDRAAEIVSNLPSYDSRSDRVDCARTVLFAVLKLQKKEADYEKAKAEQKASNARNAANREAAKLGDVRAALAVADYRNSIAVSVEGRRPPIAMTGKTTRKAFAEARSIVAARAVRREARLVAERAMRGLPNRFGEAWMTKLKIAGREIAQRYHSEVKKLYVSQYASIAYGTGGSKERGDRYRGSYSNYCKEWQNAGFAFDDERNPTSVTLYNHLGRAVVTLPLPRNERS